MKKLFKITSLFILIISIFTLTSCGKKEENPIVGIWDYYDGNSSYDNIYYTFNKDNTGSYYFYGGSNNFTYKKDEKKLTITYKNSEQNENIEVIPYETEYKIQDGILTIKDNFDNDVMYKKR